MGLTGKYKMEKGKSKMEVNIVNPVSLTHSQIPEQRPKSVANMFDAPTIQDDSASLEAIKELRHHRYGCKGNDYHYKYYNIIIINIIIWVIGYH